MDRVLHRSALHVENGLITVSRCFAGSAVSMMPISLGRLGCSEAALVWLLARPMCRKDASAGDFLLFGIVTTAANLVGVLAVRNGVPRACKNSSIWVNDGAAGPAFSNGPYTCFPLGQRHGRTVDFGGGKIETYHAIDQAD